MRGEEREGKGKSRDGTTPSKKTGYGPVWS